MSKPTVYVVDFEEELDLVLGSLSSKLVDGVDELLEGDGPAVIFVKYLEDPLHEEWLQHNFIQFNQKQNRASVVISPSWWMLPVDMVFVLIA